MPCLRDLTRLTRLARLVLVGWLLALGVAIAAPAVRAPQLEMICAGGVMKLQVQGDADAAPTPLGMECPLCQPLAGPPPALPPAPALATGPQAAPAGSWGQRVAQGARAPLPARGPPAGPTA